jgi:hypothetical protein
LRVDAFLFAEYLDGLNYGFQSALFYVFSLKLCPGGLYHSNFKLAF